MIDLRNYAVLGLGAALVAALAWGGTQSMRLADEKTDHANTKTANSEIMRAAAKATAQESERARTEEARREAAKEREIAHAQEQRRDAVAAAGRADRAADGMRSQLAAFVSGARARAATANPAAAQRGEAADAAVDLLAELYRGTDQRAGELAQALDVSRSAGLTCERLYDSLTNTTRKEAAHD